jgi:beta-lactamase regulating signal transducer with metallopeptidase domain
LTLDERRALLAHERSHLTHRHAWWVLAADLATAVNPLLGPTTRAIRHATERWADEDAATAVRDRRLVARTVAHAALLQRRGHRHRSPAPAATGGEIPRRVAAMLAPKPRSRPLTLAALGILAATVFAAAAAVGHTSEALFEHAGISASYQPAPQ